MSGLSVIQWGFLAAGFAAVAPLIIHLLFRPKPQKMYIGSVRFLQSVVREHHRRRRVRQWILLALRMCAVVLLALVFARPYFDEAHRSQLEQIVILLVDRSASMRNTDARGVTAFDQAIKEARRHMTAIPDNVAVHVGAFDAAGVREGSVEDLASLGPVGWAATDYQAGLAWANDLLTLSPRPQKRVVLITDLQSTAERRITTDPFPPGTRFEIVDVGEVVTQNAAIELAEAWRTEIRPEEGALLKVRLANQGPLPAADLDLCVDLLGPAGRCENRQRIHLAPSAKTAIDIPLELPEPGLYRGRVHIAGSQGAAWDNERWLAFEARHPDRILLVDGQEGHSVYTSETYFLETALRLRSEDARGMRRSFEVERIIWNAGQGFPNLDGVRAIVLANVRRITDTDRQRLRQYLEAGGSVMIFPGDQVRPSDWNALAADGAFPGTLANDPVTGRLPISSYATEHEAFQLFADPQYGDPRRLVLDRILPLATLNPNARTLLSCGEHVLAAEIAAGKGRCIYFGVTADRQWSRFPQSRLYVPVVRQLTAYLTGQLADREVIATTVINKADEKPGIGSHDQQLVVRNVDSRELAAERWDEEQLRAAFGLSGKSSTLDEQVRHAAIELPADVLRPDELWTALVWMLFTVLLVEMLLASRIPM